MALTKLIYPLHSTQTEGLRTFLSVFQLNIKYSNSNSKLCMCIVAMNLISCFCHLISSSESIKSRAAKVEPSKYFESSNLDYVCFHRNFIEIATLHTHMSSVATCNIRFVSTGSENPLLSQ